MNYDNILSRIKKYREKKNLTQNSIAELLCMNKRSYQCFENGENKGMDMLKLEQIARVLGLDMNKLISPEPDIDEL